MGEQEQEIIKGAEGEYFQVGKVYQVSVGSLHFGLWASREEAETHIKANVPGAKLFEGLPIGSEPIPEGHYYIQPRAVYSHTKPIAK